MPLFRIKENILETVVQTSFPKEGLREREDLQRLLRDQPSILEEGLFVIAEEYGNWQDSGRKIDLLCLGRDRRLVVVELKRDDRGGHMDLQAIRYAAMVSNMTFDQVVEAHEKYLIERRIEEDAETRISSHLLSEDTGEPELYSERPRIILASGDFSKELTTSVIWLNNAGLDVKCIRIRPYKLDNQILVDVTQVLPLPEAEDYLVKIREKASESEKQRQAPRPVKGVALFEKSLADLPTERQGTLKSVIDWALQLEKDGLANLYSNQGVMYTTLQPRIPGNSAPITIFNNKGNVSMALFRSVFERNMPEFIDKIEKVFLSSRKMGQGTEVRNISEDLLSVIREAYLEASR